MIRPWMVTVAIAVVLGFVVGSIAPPNGLRWFNRLKRPRWLTFEKLIPVIWTFVFVCAAFSAAAVWDRDLGSSRTWTLMGVYLLLELVTLAYNPAMQFRRSLMVGTIIGGIGFLIGLGLAIAVWSIDPKATYLLVPYLLWTPIGTYTTWAMSKLNPLDA